MQDWQKELPIAKESVCVKNCEPVTLWTSEPFRCRDRDASEMRRLVITARWDDRHGNGANCLSFDWSLLDMNGVCHMQYAKGAVFASVLDTIPADVRRVLRFEGCYSAGPFYYIENTVFCAGDRDCNGLRHGEARQIIDGRTKLPSWILAAVDAAGNEVAIHQIARYADSETQPPCPYRLEYRPWLRVGEGKLRELDAARKIAIWPDATDDELCADDLAERLKQRLPAVLAELRQIVETLGFVW